MFFQPIKRQKSAPCSKNSFLSAFFKKLTKKTIHVSLPLIILQYKTLCNSFLKNSFINFLRAVTSRYSFGFLHKKRRIFIPPRKICE